FGIGIYDEEHNRIDFPATKEKGQTLPWFSNSLDDPSRPAVWCFKNRKEFVVGDYETEYEKYLPATKTPIAGDAASSIIYLPLIHQDKAVGVITTQSFQKDAYSDYDVSVLRTLAAYAAIAIDNAAAYRKLGKTLKDLQTMQQQLIQSEKMASLGSLTAGIAHEIKNPLNFINNFAEVNEELTAELREAAARGEPVDELIADLQQNATVILQHGKRADSIVKSMMQHASGGTGRREPTDVNALVAEHADLAYHGKRVQLPDLNVNLIRNLDEGAGKVEMIPQEIGRVLLNLIGNAFDAVHEHATAMNGQYAPTVTVSTMRKNGTVEIIVSDDGPGIPAKVRDHIFEPFFTTKATGVGTGLGLSLSHDIVTQGHKGTLTVQSEPGKGATFIVSLPTG
ncbi:MAG: GAF domain-containing protein, partial [Rhodothermales bacterium]|nr:GAF domain-containing protein [Rhodothermales bacterium]